MGHFQFRKSVPPSPQDISRQISTVSMATERGVPPNSPEYLSSNFYRESRLHGNGVCGWDIRPRTTCY
ncbi:hypothetical protein CDAR_503151 [Caerostris darwini]|uniref:Uncharacterized protein n=1 Tax=Caerostris darwini TaxID=1538125 RepID=A0AAV4VM14_9ARAC|nr:hypothetical protein CDAR_503151 [Caerostris darwini]